MPSMMKSLLVSAGLAAIATAFPEEDLVTSLPQMPDLSFGMYSGYLPINGTSK